MKEKALQYHQHNGVGNGKIEVIPKVSIKFREELSLAYTPGVAVPCLEIEKNPELIYDYTAKGNTVFVVSDGSAVLGLGNIGAAASMPVMEGKSLLFKIFGGIDAYPIILNTQDTEKIIETVKMIALGAGGINLEDISAPRCFEIEQRLSDELDIPVFHDDQHGTAVVALAGLMNAFKIVNKKMEAVKMVINGSGAAGIAIAKLMISAGAKNIILCDREGAVYKGRKENMNGSKAEIAEVTNLSCEKGTLGEVIRGADVFLGVSAKDVLTKDMVKSMAKDAIVFAMANPDPEILPDDAYAAGAAIVATGRSDYANQVNNALGFPGIFRGLLEVRARKVSQQMKIAAAKALADFVTKDQLEQNTVIPSVYDSIVFAHEAEAVGQQAIREGLALKQLKEGEIFHSTAKILSENTKRFFK